MCLQRGMRRRRRAYDREWVEEVGRQQQEDLEGMGRWLPQWHHRRRGLLCDVRKMAVMSASSRNKGVPQHGRMVGRSRVRIRSQCQRVSKPSIGGLRKGSNPLVRDDAWGDLFVSAWWTGG